MVPRLHLTGAASRQNLNAGLTDQNFMTFLPHRANRGVRHTGDPTNCASIVYRGNPKAALFPKWPRPVETAAQPHPNPLAPYITCPNMQRCRIIGMILTQSIATDLRRLDIKRLCLIMPPLVMIQQRKVIQRPRVGRMIDTKILLFPFA